MTATGFLLALWTLATSLPYVIPATRAVRPRTRARAHRARLRGS